MYRYVTDKRLLSSMKQLYGDILQDLCHQLKEDYDIGARFYMVGSGAKNMILQNEKNPIDLDYNLEIIRCKDIKNCRVLKESVRKTFNKVLRSYEFSDCEDSTSSLTTEKMYFTEINNDTRFSADVTITYRKENGTYYRLIHKKTGVICKDEYYWTEVAKSKLLNKKVQKIKNVGAWNKVRDQYLRIKNRYLSRINVINNNHPSFICYIEAVNNVYNEINNS